MPQSNSFCCDKKSSTAVSTINTQTIPTIFERAPDWSGVAVKDAQMYELSLQDYKGKYLVFIFYPCDFTFVCPTELIQFSNSFEEFKKIGTIDFNISKLF